MKRNNNLQNTNYKQCTCLKEGRCDYNVQDYKQKTKGSYGLHQDSFALQTMTALIKSFCGGSRGAVFSKRAPLVAEGKREGVNK
jgi:hypothetical protein